MSSRQFKLRKPEPLEKEIQQLIIEYLNAKGIFCWKEHSGGIMVDGGTRYMPIGLRGKSDILGVYKGRFLAIEVKRPSGVVSQDQRDFISMVNTHGGVAFIARSLEDVIQNLHAADKVHTS